MNKNILSRSLALLAALCIAITSLPPAYALSPVQGRAPQTHTVTGDYQGDTETLRKLINSDAVQDGDTIRLIGSCMVNDLNSNSAPWVINKRITITGDTLYLRSGGIVLGADVTFTDVNLSFANCVRNAIMANGYTLTLNNVSSEASTRRIHLLCGGLTGDVKFTDPIPQPGNNGRIIIQGSTSLGNLYAGSLSGDGQPNGFSGNAEIVIANGATGKMGDIYASGALETYIPPNSWFDQTEPAPPSADPEQFSVSGKVNIQLYNTSVLSVNGDTGIPGNAPDITYYGKEFPNEVVTLQNIASLTVQNGNLKPKSGSSFADENASVSVSNQATLDLTNFDPNLTINNFSGGGSLILGQTQTLNIQGDVTGSTRFGAGSINGFSGASQALTAGHTYIRAPRSGPDSFILAEASDSPARIKLVRNTNGDWVGTDLSSGGNTDKTIVTSFQLPPQVTISTQIPDVEALIPIQVEYSADTTYPSLSAVPLTVLLDGMNLTRKEENGTYYYTNGIGDIRLEIIQNDDNEENFWVTGFSFALPDAGTYKFNITIPKEYTINDTSMRATTTLTITNDAPVTPPETPTLSSISVNSTNHKTVYQVGEPLDVTGLTIEALMSDGSSQTVPVTAGMVNGFNSAAAVANQVLTITYQGKTTTYTVTIQDNSTTPPVTPPEKPTVSSIQVKSTAHKTVYQVGEPLDVTGLTIEALMSDSSTMISPVTAGMVSGFNSAAAVENQVLTITYQGKTTTYTVTIQDNSTTPPVKPPVTPPVTPPEKPTVSSIQVKSTAHKTVYQVGEPLDVTGLTIEALMSDSSTMISPVTAGMVSGFNSAAAVENQVLTITYQGKTTTYTISVQAPPEPPAKTFRVTVQESYASNSGAGLYPKDELVRISAGSRSGYVFAGWTASGVTLENPSQADTSFRMPDHDVSVTARWSVYTPPSSGGSNGGSNGGNSNGNSGGSSNSSPSYTPPQTATQQAVSSIQSARPGSTVNMNLPSGKVVVEANVLKNLAGRQVTLNVQTGDIIWTIQGMDVPSGTSLNKLDLSVDTKAAAVPDRVVRSVAGTSRTAQFSLAHDGAFGFDAQLSMKTEKRNIGLWANLYYYNPASRALEFQHASQVDSAGRMSFPFQHASDYVVIFDKTKHKTAPSIAWSNPFRDVAQGAWYYDSVAYVHQNGLFSGTSAASFSPNAVTTRGQIVSILYNLAGSPTVRSGNTFRDVPSSAYYANAVEWAAAMGLTSGTGSGLFLPDAPVTREQLAVFLSQYAKQHGVELTGSSSLQRFSDYRSVSNYAQQPLAWAVSQGLLSGFEDGSLRPRSPATRAQTASILRQLCELLSSLRTS